MAQRSKWFGVGTGVLGLALALAPLTAASATTHKSKHHPSSKHTKGSAPNSAMCKDVKTEQSSSGSTASAIEKAATSGNFAAAKQAMLNAYDADLANVNKALGVIKTAPANVQSAFKNLLSYEKQFRDDIQNASSEEALIASFSTLGKDTKLETDGLTISNWYTSVCGGTPITATTATTVSIP